MAVQQKSPNIKCASCGKEDFDRLAGMYALTEVVKTFTSPLLSQALTAGGSNNLTFRPSSGIPVVVYACRTCGELKLIPAKLLGEV